MKMLLAIIYPKSLLFAPWPLLALRVVAFFCHSRQMSGQYLEIGHDPVLPNSTTSSLSCHSNPYSAE